MAVDFQWIYALASRISTVTFSEWIVSDMVFGWLGGDLFDFVETADAFPLLPRLPRRDPVRDPGDRHFLAKVSRALSRPYTSDTESWNTVESMKNRAERIYKFDRSEFFVAIMKELQQRLWILSKNTFELNSIWYTIKKKKRERKERERKYTIKVDNIKLWIFRIFYKKLYVLCFLFFLIIDIIISSKRHCVHMHNNCLILQVLENLKRCLKWYLTRSISLSMDL